MSDERPAPEYQQPQQVQTGRPDTQAANAGATAQSVVQTFICYQDDRARLRRVNEG
jgi:hypothetical protein